ncbi:MAG: ABC transporter permease subunit [Armatimonadetes bacterium]|nr:ABC transporter permease subunit [Armatimonadota bacterium]
MFRHITAIATKDLRIFFTDRRSMLITFLVPIVIASFFAFAMAGTAGGQKASKIPILVVNEDHDPLTDSLVQKLSANDTISVEVVDRAKAEAAVQKGDKTAAVVFGKGFASEAKSALFAGEPAKLEELYDPSKAVDRQVVQGVLMQVLMEEISKAGMSGSGAKSNLEMALKTEKDPERRQAWQGFLDSWESLDKSGAMTGATGGGGGMRQPFAIEAKAMTASKDANADLNAMRGHIFAGMAVQGIMFFAVNAAMNLLRDRRSGIWTRMKAAPVSQMSVILGNGLGAWIISAFVFLGVLAFGMLAFGFRVYGSWLGLGLVVLTASLMTAGFGLFVASLGKTEEQSRGLSMFAVIMMVMLGGAWFPMSMMPNFIQQISKVIPVRWAIDGVDATLYRGAGLLDVAIPSLVLVGFAALFSTIAVVRLRKV